MTQRTDLIGYCGLYCGDCSGYTQTVANLARDLRAELRRHRFGQMAGALAPNRKASELELGVNSGVIITIANRR